jgi:N utilization substance protein A
MAAGVATVEKLGGMTPEELEEIPGIGVDLVETIQQAVVSYYGQFEATPAQPVEEVGTEDAQEQSVTIDNQELAAEAVTLEKEQG